GLSATTVVRLEQSGVPVVTAQLARAINSTDLLVRWDLSGVALGTYDVVALNGTDRAVLPAAFTVEAARAPAVAIESDRADVLRRTAIAQFAFTFRNTSNQDVDVVRARVLYPAGSSLRALVTTPGLLSRSQRSPSLFAQLAGDGYKIVHPGGGDSLMAIDLIGTHLAPGEGRSVTVSVSGFATSPYSGLAMAGGSSLEGAPTPRDAVHQPSR